MSTLQITDLTRVLSDPGRPMERVVFVVSGDIGPTTLQRIEDANNTIRQARGSSDAPISVINVGDYR